MRNILSLVVALTVAGAVQAQPPAWPQWLGPHRDGISRERLSSDWPEDGLKILWEQEIGVGFSSISVRDGLLYSMGHRDGREYVWCLRVADGEKVWSHDYVCELVDNLYEGGPGSTPTIDGDSVYTIGKEGQLISFVAKTGEVRWRRSLQDELDIELPEWGFNGSAVIVGNQLLLECGRAVSFDKRTGAKQWQTEQHLAGYGSVTPLQHNGQSLLATLDCEGLRLLQREDGKQLDFVEWRSPFRTNSTTPTFHDGSIFISSGYNVGCGLFDLKDGKLVERYANRDMRNHFNNSILYQGHLYGFDGNSNLGRVVKLSCINWATGEVKWQQRGFGCGSLIVADGKLLIVSERGELVLAEASPQAFKELARSKLLTGRCWTTPAIAAGKLYARNATGRLVCAALPAP